LKTKEDRIKNICGKKDLMSWELNCFEEIMTSVLQMNILIDEL
jgi:hypothetical protein